MSNSVGIDAQLDFEQIKRIIPQRFPFLMLDRVVEIEPGVRLVGIKNLTANEWFYQGHFPERAITPGAMICEAIAQAGIVFFHCVHPKSEGSSYLLSGLKARFMRPAWPGDQLRIEVTPVKVTPSAGILNAKVKVNDHQIAKGEFSLAVREGYLR